MAVQFFQHGGFSTTESSENRSIDSENHTLEQNAKRTVDPITHCRDIPIRILMIEHFKESLARRSITIYAQDGPYVNAIRVT